MKNSKSHTNDCLSASREITVRFSEVDSMNIVWHGSYPLYFEDAREAFGHKYGIDYLTIFGNGYYAPLVDLSFQYKRPIVYGMTIRVDIFYRPTDAAKIVFDYEIYNVADGQLMATGSSTQVFLDKQYQLVWTNPDFYQEWKVKQGIN
ncbi:MAG: acyl-CoA thioesterase [Muribaculaceae bacterium]|nr:acyl-CoA thioesterase [Muribaculaceae bacterium]